MKTIFALLTLTLAVSSARARAETDYITGDGIPMNQEAQEVMDRLPAKQEMADLIERITPYSMALAGQLHLLYAMFEKNVHAIVRVRAVSNKLYAGYEAESTAYNGCFWLNNISVYFWDDFFALPVEDRNDPTRMTQVKALLHELLHITRSFPELKTQRLTELVYRVSLGKGSDADLRQLDNELLDWSHRLSGRSSNEYPFRGDNNCVNWVTEEYYLKNYLKRHSDSVVKAGKFEIFPPTDEWIHAYESAASPASRFRFAQSFAKLFNDPRITALLQIAGTNRENLVARWLQATDQELGSGCPIPKPALRPEWILLSLFGLDNERPGGYFNVKGRISATCEADSSSFEFSDRLAAAAARIRQLPLTRDELEKLPGPTWDLYWKPYVQKVIDLASAPFSLTRKVRALYPDGEIYRFLHDQGEIPVEKLGSVEIDGNQCDGIPLARCLGRFSVDERAETLFKGGKYQFATRPPSSSWSGALDVDLEIRWKSPLEIEE